MNVFLLAAPVMMINKPGNYELFKNLTENRKTIYGGIYI